MMSPDPRTPPLAAPMTPVSWGELLDKITILEIKAARIAEPAALANVRRELALLRDVAAPALAQAAISAPLDRLRHVNLTLWQVEDDIRAKEARQEFDACFVALARAVYRTNDERAAIKRELNRRLGSELVEEKSYADPGPAANPSPATGGTERP